jgi:hypothetical protein
MNADVVAISYDEGRAKLLGAMIKRRKTEEALRKEESELAHAANSTADTIVQNSPGRATDDSLSRAVQGAHTTIAHLTDRALIYYEEISRRTDLGITPDRLMQFKKNLAIDEIKKEAKGISANDIEGTRKGIKAVSQLLEHAVYTGKDIEQERSRALQTLKNLEDTISKRPTQASSPPHRDTKKGEDSSPETLMLRLVNNRAVHEQARDPMVMFSSLPQSEIKGRTDSSGRCTLSIPSTGRWIIAVGRQRDASNFIAEAFGVRKSDCWIQELPAGSAQVNFTEENRLTPGIAPLGLEQEIPWN